IGHRCAKAAQQDIARLCRGQGHPVKAGDRHIVQQPGDVLLCCFGSSVPNHAAIYCGDGELLHHLPEQLSKRERYSEKWQRRTHSAWRHRHWLS
ncbi:NlpC/P60 family protein, partial [Escherichia coli]|nr:NlpC/P60 family protein [Escherichia coli]